MNVRSINSFLLEIDPVTIGKYQVTYGIGHGKMGKGAGNGVKYDNVVVVDAVNRFDAIKQVKSISPFFMVDDIKYLGGQYFE